MGMFTASRLKKMKMNYRAGNYEKAVGYAVKLKPEEIHTAYDLSMIADTYMAVGDYEDAKLVYAEMFKRSHSARICKEMIKICLKSKDVKQAISLTKELRSLDYDDYERYIFQYQIGKMLGQPDDYLIACLKKVREADYIDVWALELAKLYYKTGQNDSCIAECKNIKLWFPETEYSNKADILLQAVGNGVAYDEAYTDVNEEAPEEEEYEEAPVEEAVEEVEEAYDDDEEIPTIEEISEDEVELDFSGVFEDEEQIEPEDETLYEEESEELTDEDLEEIPEEELAEEELEAEELSEEFFEEDEALDELEELEISEEEEYVTEEELAVEDDDDDDGEVFFPVDEDDDDGEIFPEDIEENVNENIYIVDDNEDGPEDFFVAPEVDAKEVDPEDNPVAIQQPVLASYLAYDEDDETTYDPTLLAGDDEDDDDDGEISPADAMRLFAAKKSEDDFQEIVADEESEEIEELEEFDEEDFDEEDFVFVDEDEEVEELEAEPSITSISPSEVSGDTLRNDDKLTRDVLNALLKSKRDEADEDIIDKTLIQMIDEER